MNDVHPEAARLEAKVAELRVRIQTLEEQDFRWLELRRVLRRLLLLTVKRPCQAFGERVRRLLRRAAGPRRVTRRTAAFQPYQVRPRAGSIEVTGGTRRVLHVMGNFVTGGSSQLVVDLIERLSADYEQRVLTRHLPDPPAYTGLRIEEETLLTGAGERRLGEMIEQWMPDLVHVHYWGTYDWEWYHRVFQILARTKHRPRIVENVNVPIAPYIHPGINAYVFVSEYVRREFCVPGANNHVIYPGSNFALFSSAPAALDEAKTASDLSIGMVYRLSGDKINRSSIDVFIAAVQKVPGLRAVIVGGGPLLKPYQKAVAAAGLEEAFEFTGAVSYEKLPGIYRRMGVFVAPVHTESFGQVTPFAMNMRIPVAGYRVGALPEIVGDDRLLAAPADSAALSDIIADLARSPAWRTEVGEANFRRAQALFSVEAMIVRYEALYRSLLLPPSFLPGCPR